MVPLKLNQNRRRSCDSQSVLNNCDFQIKRQRGRPRKLSLQSQDESKIKVPRAQNHKTKPQAVQKLRHYSLRRKQELPNTENHERIEEANLAKVEQQSNAKVQLPNNSA